MAAVENHYEFLGLTPSASHEEIEAAIDRVSEQAITLVYTSPQRSSDLWERIRHMRRDLVASPEGRQVYDEALQRSQNLAGGSGLPVEGTVPFFRVPEIESAVPVRIERRPPRLAAFARMPEEEQQTRGVAWPYALIAAAAVFVIVAGALLARQPGATPGRRPVAMTLSQVGSSHGSKFVSGGSVALAWTRVAHASMYRLQIATEAGDPSDAVVFAHGVKTVLVAAPPYHVQVAGPQLYYWRVQARVAGIWQPYTRSQHFAVARPVAAQPVALAPVTGQARGGKNVRLCWSAVSGAIGYRLRIHGERTRTVSGTCVTLTVRHRTYRWSVAALVKGVHVYTGSYSVAAVVHIRPKHVAHRPRAHSATRGGKLSTTSHARKHGSSSKHRSTPTSVEVAIALPPQASGSQRSSTTGSSLRTTAARISAHLGSSPAVARVHRRATAVRPTSGTARTGRSKPGTSISSTSVPRPPSVKKHTTPTGTAIPPPPSPPSVPTGTSAPPIPTQIVTASRSSTSSTIEVHPIVSTQTATSAPAGPTSTTPAVRSPSPVPSKTASSPPSATPTQSFEPSHPAHPVHPAHPTHPSHPSHP